MISELYKKQLDLIYRASHLNDMLRSASLREFNINVFPETDDAEYFCVFVNRFVEDDEIRHVYIMSLNSETTESQYEKVKETIEQAANRVYEVCQKKSQHRLLRHSILTKLDKEEKQTLLETPPHVWRNIMSV